MHLLRRLRMPKFNFSAASKPPKAMLRSSLPSRNGGVNCIPRKDVVNYYRQVCSKIRPRPTDASETANMIPEVRYFY